MKPIKIFTIKPNTSDLHFSISLLGIGSLFIYVLYQGYLHSDYYISLTFLLLVCIRVFYYAAIDLSLPKKLYIKNNELYVKCLVSFRVNIDKCYLKVEEYDSPVSYQKFNILVLCRNNNTYGSRFFKNKIKLRCVYKSNVDQVLSEAKLISNMFEIRLYDFDITDLS